MATSLTGPPSHIDGFSWCWCHHVYEPVPKRVFVVCYECGHVWTKRTLKRAYRRAVIKKPDYEVRSLLNPHYEDDFAGPSWAMVLWRVLTVRAEDIFFCQECIHDF